MHPRTVLAVGNFFLAISSTLVGYTLISYLGLFIPTFYIGLVIAAGAAISLGLFIFLPNLIAIYTPQRLGLQLAFIETILLFAVAAAPETYLSAIFVVIVLSLHPLLYYALDLLLEATVENESTTGRVRAFFITGYNSGAFVAPLLIGTLLATNENYSNVFFAAAVAIVPFIVLFAARRLPKGVTPSISHVRDTLTHIRHNRDIAAVTIAHLLLYIFFVWAPLYIPVYLHTTLGIPWSTLGWVFSVMLIPYVLIEYPAGWIADRMLGDKELMVAGFFIAGSALTAVSTLTKDSSLLTILLILCATRVGAALVESMTEGHFFRRVSEKDIVSVSVFRGVWPLANIIAPLMAAIILYIGSYQLFFILTGGFILVAGMTAAMSIRDFR